MDASVTAAIPHLKIVEALMTFVAKLIPSRDRIVKGHLQPKTARGVGASLALAEKSGSLVKQVTLRQADYGPVTQNSSVGAADYAVLLPAATYWVRDAISENGESWVARALFDAGTRLQQDGDFREARRLYDHALTLAHDPPILGVVLNLATIEIKQGAADPKNLDYNAIRRGIARLELALQRLNEQTAAT